MLSDPFTLSLLIIITIALGIICWIVFLRKPLILIILSLLILVSNVILEQEIISFEIGIYNINVLDFLSVFFITNAIGRIFLSPKKRRADFFIILLLGVLLFISWLRGIFVYGLEISTNSIRTYLYFYSFIFYTCNLEYSQQLHDKVFSWIKKTGFLIIIVALVRWALVIFSDVSSAAWVAPNGSMVRVLYASAAFFVLQLLIILTHLKKTNENHVIFKLTQIAIICMILALQQRTVWAALLIFFILYLLFKYKQKNLVILGIIFLTVITTFILVINDFSIENLTGTALDFQNLNWRIEGWQSLLAPERFNSPLELLIGQPFGSGYSRFIFNSVFETTVSPHNFYIQTLLNIGSIGLLSLGFLYGSIIHQLLKLNQNKTSQLLIILLTSQLVFYFSYAPSFEQGLILGLSILYVQNVRNQQIILMVPQNTGGNIGNLS